MVFSMRKLKSINVLLHRESHAQYCNKWGKPCARLQCNFIMEITTRKIVSNKVNLGNLSLKSHFFLRQRNFLYEEAKIQALIPCRRWATASTNTIRLNGARASFSSRLLDGLHDAVVSYTLPSTRESYTFNTPLHRTKLLPHCRNGQINVSPTSSVCLIIFISKSSA